jgi:hypothetical protein
MNEDQITQNMFQTQVLNTITAEFARLKRLAEGAFAQLQDEDFHRRPDGGENTIAIIVQHLAGNMKSRWTDFLTTDGEKPDRHRDQEFIDGHRVIVDFWRLWEPGQQAPINCELFAPPTALHSPALMMKILTATATIAASLGVEELGLPYPSALPLEAPPAWVGQREFEWAWLRKRV